MQTFHYSAVEAQAVPGSEGASIRWLMGTNVGAPNFITRLIELQPGAATEYHQHAWEHEVFVLEGLGAVQDASGWTEVGPGSCVYVVPGEIHQFANRGDTPLRFICVIPVVSPKG